MAHPPVGEAMPQIGMLGVTFPVDAVEPATIAVTLRELVDTLLDRSVQAVDLAAVLRVRKGWPI